MNTFAATAAAQVAEAKTAHEASEPRRRFNPPILRHTYTSGHQIVTFTYHRTMFIVKIEHLTFPKFPTPEGIESFGYDFIEGGVKFRHSDAEAVEAFYRTEFPADA